MVEAPVPGIGVRRGGCFDEIVDPEALAAGVLDDGDALAAGILLGGGHAQVGDGFHVAADGTVSPALNVTFADFAMGNAHG